MSRLRAKRLAVAMRCVIPLRRLLARTDCRAMRSSSGEYSERPAARLPMTRCSDHSRRPKRTRLQHSATAAGARTDQ